MAAELIFVGTGEALDPALANTSLLLRGPKTLLLDCGYAVPHAFWRICQDVDALDGVWISHGHADHCFGLPALLLWMRLGGRERPLTILGGPGSKARIEQVLELGYPGSFAAHKCYALDFVELDGQAEVAHGWGPLELRVAASRHSIPNYALRVEAPGLRSFVYSGDGSPTAATRALIRGAELLVHECFFPAAPPGTAPAKHGDLDELLALAEASPGLETLALVHFAAEAKAELRDRVAALAGSSLGFEILAPRPGDRLSLAR